MAGKQAEEYWMQDYEVLTMILSALMWRKYNGGIRLCADEEARAFIEKLGLAHIWNLGIEEITVPEAVPEKVFWAAGKLYSLKKMQMPAVMVDLDLIIWKDIRNIIKDTDICAIHREGIFPDVYPGKEFFHMKPEYRFDPDWSFEVLPVNTCMLYIADEAFKNYYVDSSITFMENCLETEENLCHMVFAEQRLLAMCAEKQGKQISSFFPGSAQIENQDIFTHLWGYKNILKFNYKEREAFNRKMYDRIVREFPEEETTLKQLPISGL
jgi:hypothetical protein